MSDETKSAVFAELLARYRLEATNLIGHMSSMSREDKRQLSQEIEKWKKRYKDAQ